MVVGRAPEKADLVIPMATEEMARSGYESWELDKGEINFDFRDVGLDLKKLQQQQQQQQRQQNSVSWLQTRRNQLENSRSPSPSPTISWLSSSRFGVTFTAGQRQELERQTMILMYMMASILVPAELLMPLFKYPSSPISTPSPGNFIWNNCDRNQEKSSQCSYCL